MYGPLGFLFDLPFGNVTDQFDKDPTQIWIAARVLAALLCMGGVAATYWAARRLWGVREGLVAAAVMAFAFLPVAYSRVAVTDVGALIGVALALLFAVRVYEGRGRRPLADFALAGAFAGLAVAFKYTAGLALLPLVDRRARPAALGRRPGGGRPRARRRARGARVRGAQPVPVRVARRLVDRPPRPGRGGRRRPEAGPGVRRVRVLPRQPHLGARVGGRLRGARGSRARAASRRRARADARRGAGGAVRVPERAVALLRPLAAAGLSGARDAGGGRPHTAELPGAESPLERRRRSRA